MTFADLAVGESVFLDANTLVYHFQPHPIFGMASNQLLTRVENQELVAFTSTHILTEVAHRLMMIEAASLPGWKAAKVKLRLQQQPGMLNTLTQFRTAIESVLQSRIQVLTTAPALIRTAAGISQSAGLLSSDALLVAIMQQHGLTKLASGDGDFDRVTGITRYAPA